MQNILNAIEQGIITNTTNKRLCDLEKQQKELTEQILIEQSKATIQFTESEIRQYYVQALRLEPQILVSLLIKEVVLFADKIQIYFNNPITTSPDDNQDFSFFVKNLVFHHQTTQRQVVKHRDVIVEMYI